MSCQHPLREKLPWYVNGTLPAAERSTVQAHLQACADCSRTAAGLKALAAGLAVRAPAPAPELKQLPARRPQPSFNWQWGFNLLRIQARVVRGEIWPASALIMALGLVVTLVAADTLPLVLVAPVIAAVGVAFIYGPTVDPALEIELATPTSPRSVLLARLALVFGYDLVLGLLGSLLLALLATDVSLWPLVMSWLAPMAFLSSLALLLAVLSVDSGLGALVSLVLWVLFHLFRSDDLSPFFFSIPDILAASSRPWLWLLSVLMASLAVLISGREERWLGKGA
jgi:hypothetical protein